MATATTRTCSGRRSSLSRANGNGHANGNGTNGHHEDEAPEPQQSLFSWAEFMAEEPVKPKRNRKPQPASLSMFEWAMTLEEQREKEAGRRRTLDRIGTGEAAAP